MTGRRRINVAAIGWALGLALACGKSPSHGTGQSPCDNYFDAIVGVTCRATTPPADEVARIRLLFETVCQNALALPGNGITDTSLEACASALDSVGCGTANLGIAECTFQGSLADGSPCNDSSQCSSGDCKVAGVGLSDGGTTNQCGTCTEDFAVGRPCGSTDRCAAGSVCDGTPPSFACTAITYGDVGATCDGLATECKTGLYCDLTTSQCSSPGGADTPCTQTPACTPPLVCTGGAAGTGMTCRDPAPAGTTCHVDEECASGLGCAGATQVCTSITWVSQGQPCTDVDRCLVGNCPIMGGPGSPDGGQGVPGGTCPTVIADGQPCTGGDATHTCDTFSFCTNGACQQPDSLACQ